MTLRMTQSTRKQLDELPRRERQIMDTLFELGEGSVEEVRSHLRDPPSYSAVRALLGRLERKGLVDHGERDLKYVYRATVSVREARISATDQLIQTFYEGSFAVAAHGLLERSVDRLDEEELDRLARLIEQARRSRAVDRDRGDER